MTNENSFEWFTSKYYQRQINVYNKTKNMCKHNKIHFPFSYKTIDSDTVFEGLIDICK